MSRFRRLFPALSELARLRLARAVPDLGVRAVFVRRGRGCFVPTAYPLEER